MSTKIQWTRLDAGEWMNEVSCLSPTEKCIYVMLRFQMLYTGEPLLNDFKALSLYVGYPVKTFIKALDLLLLKKKIISLEDGRLWNLDVEEELNDSKENLNKFSERASKAAHARWDKQKKLNDSLAISDDENVSDDVKHNAKHNAYAMLVDAINNNNNIYKKTNTIVLSKKENVSEDLATEVSVQGETTDEMVEKHLDHDTLSSENQSPVSEQKSPEKKTKRSRSGRESSIPEDFKPNLKYATDKGLTEDEALFEFERFKNYWLARPKKCAEIKDWQLTWYNWVTSNYGLLVQKKAKLEKEKQNGRYGNYSQRQRSFTECLAESFESSRHDFSSGDDYEEDQPRVSIDLQEWERIDQTGGRKSLGCLQPSAETVQCESFG
ncbi:DUF1376 domain-containing protein [Bartonella bovis]|uniref:Phage related protein n=1 Tax=Bartonella bovis m02 TaxID=1094492 RepID=N6VJ27_9HYPH|nr:DUF1376 domain-containing protein [Bartonella bovis]ENN93226.1 hypothetical protein m02_02310 [Bartonella bovis m02]